MSRPDTADDAVPLREALERLEALGEKLDRTLAEMRDLRARYIARAEAERRTPRARAGTGPPSERG